MSSCPASPSPSPGTRRGPPFLPAKSTLFLAAILLFVILLRLTSTDRSSPSVDPLRVLVFCHAAVCFLAGVYGGDHLFAWEERRSTLAELRLLPYAATQWLA